jgi:hypothetical protein
MRDPIYLFDISTGPLGDRNRDKHFDNPQKRRTEAEDRLGHSARILSGIPSAREINYCPSLALLRLRTNARPEHSQCQNLKCQNYPI